MRFTLLQNGIHVLLHRVHQLAAGVAVHRTQLTVKALKLHLRRQVGAVFIQQQTHRRGRQETAKLQLFRCLGFNHVDELQQQCTHRQRLVLQQRNGAAAGIAGEDEIQTIADQRVLPGDELRVFTGQRHITLKGDGAAIFRQAREVRDQHMIGRRQHNHVFAAIVLVDTDDIKQVHGEADQAGIVILLFDALCQRLGLFAAVGVDLQQTVTALLQLRFQRFVLFATGFDQIIEAIGVFRRRQVACQLAMYVVVNGTTGRAGMFKRIQTFMEPAHQHGLGGFFQIRNVDLNVVRLANTIQTADTLLKQIRVEGQIEHHQTAGELEVTPFGADFGTEQYLCAAVLF